MLGCTRFVSFAILLLLAMSCSRSKDPATSSSVPPESLGPVLEAFNRGVGLMDRYEPVAAAAEFEKVVALAPGWVPARLNLGIAHLNSKTEEGYRDAENELKRVLDMDESQPVAHYALGVLMRHFNRLEEARPYFERVIEIDPDDADAHYQLAIVLGKDEADLARIHLEKALELAPHHESASYRLQGLLRRTGEVERAQAVLRRFRDLKTAKAGFASGMRYGEMGRYANVVRAFEREGELPPTEDTMPEFVDRAAAAGFDAPAGGGPGWPGESAAEIREIGAAAFGPGVAVTDLDGDGDLDVFTTVSGAGDGGGTVYRNEGERFAQLGATAVGIDARDAVGAFCGDYDRDGDPDLYLTCAGPNRLYRNDGSMKFTDVTASTGTAGSAALSVGASWADADHDGDLDLYVANYCAWPWPADDAPGALNSLLRNNGDGTFEDVAVEAGVDGGKTPTVGVVFFDADGDRDLDLYVVHDRAVNRLFLNDRVGQYTEATARFGELDADGPATGALLGDVDRDGREDLLLLRGHASPRLLLQVSRGRFEQNEAFAASLRDISGAIGGALADLDLDGDLDLALFGAVRQAGDSPQDPDDENRHVLLPNSGSVRFGAPISLGTSERGAPTCRGAVAADVDGDGAVELLIARAGATPQFFKASGLEGRHWLSVSSSRLSSTENEDPVDKSNLGMLVEIKTGQELQIERVSSSQGYLGSPPPIAHFGLGRYPKADYARLDWPDGVIQSELEIAADQNWEVVKVLRKPSSCPVLFSWDGERFVFVTDFLGVGGVGFFMTPGEYAPPDPTETIRIPPEHLAVRDGRYELRIAEPLEEVSYIDEMYVTVYDHPEDVELYPDERFTGSPPFPTGRAQAVRDKIFPAAATDSRGEEILGHLRAIDRQYASPPNDTRFVGYADDHWIELDFDDRLRAFDDDARLVLYLYGWVEYTYSHVNYAAHQAGITMRSPWIEVPDGEGGWVVAMEEAGFPAGLPRMMTLDVSSLPIRDSGKFRIRTNMEVFWDQIFIGEDVADSSIREQVLKPVVADLRPLGYPREYSPDGANPTLYDYDRIDGGVSFKNMAGEYTRFGDVRELLDGVDDRFVIMGRGELIALSFDCRALGDLPQGYARTVFLQADGYCKDMDFYTAFPDTVGPLPYHAMENYPPTRPFPDPAVLHRDRAEWQTRVVEDDEGIPAPSEPSGAAAQR